MEDVQECRRQYKITLAAVRAAIPSATDPANYMELKEIEEQLVQALSNLDEPGGGGEPSRGGD